MAKKFADSLMNGCALRASERFAGVEKQHRF
jgi:hypothetical protein